MERCYCCGTEIKPGMAGSMFGELFSFEERRKIDVIKKNFQGSGVCIECKSDLLFANLVSL